MVNNGKRWNKKPKKHGSKRKYKKFYKSKPTTRALKPSGCIPKEITCFYCGKTERWKINYLKYLEDKKNEVEISTLCIFVIKINLSTFASGYWILDVVPTFILM